MSRRRLENIAASLFLIGLCVLIYATVPYLQSYFSRYVVISETLVTYRRVLETGASAYALLLTAYYLGESQPGISKSVFALRAVLRLLTSLPDTLRRGLPADERLGLLSTLLKMFFAPLMIVWLIAHLAQIQHYAMALSKHWMEEGSTPFALFKAQGFWLLLQLILLLDVVFYTVGYLVELPRLKNQIRSVDPTLAGWAVALACYPPFNSATNRVLGWHSADYPQFSEPAVHVAVNLLLLMLMAVFTWASVALNFKASNLTHRGIVDRGPYRHVRHPAYLAKNLAWWLALIPALADALQTSMTAAMTVAGSMAAWSLIYVLRALTEEQHLRSVDGEYERYCQRVKYRFVPGVW